MIFKPFARGLFAIALISCLACLANIFRPNSSFVSLIEAFHHLVVAESASSSESSAERTNSFWISLRSPFSFRMTWPSSRWQKATSREHLTYNKENFDLLGMKFKDTFKELSRELNSLSADSQQDRAKGINSVVELRQMTAR